MSLPSEHGFILLMDTTRVEVYGRCTCGWPLTPGYPLSGEIGHRLKEEWEEHAKISTHLTKTFVDVCHLLAFLNQAYKAPER